MTATLVESSPHIYVNHILVQNLPMLRTLKMDTRTYPSFERCIFCGSAENLTDEHIVPYALSGLGEMKIRNGSCRIHNNYANQAYEQPALKADFLTVRHMLELKRRNRGKKKSPRKMPRVSYAPWTGVGHIYDQELSPNEYPPFWSFIIHPPAGLLVGEDRPNAASSISLGEIPLGTKISPETHRYVTTRTPFIIAAPELLVAKMAYCHAVAERGLDFAKYADIIDILVGNRSGIFNFVGQPLIEEKLSRDKLHNFYFRRRGKYETVLVHLFASFGGPIYEVVLGLSQ